MPNGIIHNEHELLRSISEGDQKAFQQIFDTYWDRIFANALHFLKDTDAACDLTQEVFIRIWTGRGKLAEVLHFEAYLYRVSKNIFLDHLRKHLVKGSYEIISALNMPAKDPDAQDRLELNELETQVQHAISYLPVQMQKAFRLSRFNGLTHEEIARKMNISKITSQNYIARSLILIRKHLQHHLGHYLLLFFFAEKFI